MQFLEYFVWKPSKRMWKIGEQRDSIDRIVAAHPGEDEKYYLRLLLTKVKCPTTFADLRTFGGVQVQTFHETALLGDYWSMMMARNFICKKLLTFICHMK